MFANWQGRPIEIHGQVKEYDGRAEIILEEYRQLSGSAPEFLPCPKIMTWKKKAATAPEPSATPRPARLRPGKGSQPTCPSKYRKTRTDRGECASSLAACFSARTTHIRNLDSERGGQINLVILFIHQNLPDLLGHGKPTQSFTLSNPVPVVANGLIFVFQIEAQHLVGIVGGLHRFGLYRGHFAQIVDLARDDQCVVQFLFGMNGQLIGYVHIFGALQDLGINHVGDDGLIFS